jgi:hypothetical protein
MEPITLETEEKPRAEPVVFKRWEFTLNSLPVQSRTTTRSMEVEDERRLSNRLRYTNPSTLLRIVASSGI